MDGQKNNVIEIIERGAEYLYGYRKLYFASWPIAYAVLGIFYLRGHDTTCAFLLTFMWLFGLGFFVSGLRWSANQTEIERHKGVAPDFVYQLVKSQGFYYYWLFIGLFWFAFLTFITFTVAGGN